MIKLTFYEETLIETARIDGDMRGNKMAFGMYLNLEVLTKNIIDKCIENMTDSNIGKEIEMEICDENKFANNLENGFIVVVMLISYVESFVNTILRDCSKFQKEKLLKFSIEEKFEIIFYKYEKDFGIIKSNHFWETYKKISKIRNNLIHYKNNYVGDSGGYVVDVIISDESLKSLFRKCEMKKISNDIYELSKLVVDSLELSFHEDVKLFDCDGINENCSYIYNPQK